MGFLDKARDAAQQALSQAQQGVAQGQTKLDELQTKRAVDGFYRDLGAAFYAEQREGGPRQAVVDALGDVDRYISMHPDEHQQAASSGSGAAPSSFSMPTSGTAPGSDPGAQQPSTFTMPGTPATSDPSAAPAPSAPAPASAPSAPAPAPAPSSEPSAAPAAPSWGTPSSTPEPGSERSDG